MSDRTPLDVLRAARKRIENPTRWCQGQYARSRTGRSVNPTGRAAARWCALGALRAETNLHGSVHDAALRRLIVAADPSGVTSINDVRGHAAVLDIYDRAIAAEERRHAAS